MTSVPPTQPPAAPETGIRLTEAERKSLWRVIAGVRDGAARLPNDADTEDIIDAILDSGWIYRLVAERVRVVEGERDQWRGVAIRRESLHDQIDEATDRAEAAEAERDKANAELAVTAEVRDVAQATSRLMQTRAESAEAAHAALVAGIEGLAEEAAERAYMQIAVEKCLTVMRVGEGRAAVPPHWRDAAELIATIPVADLRALLAGGEER